MDAGKIRSLISGIDLRADHGLGSQSGHHSDAEIIVSKVATLLALDSLMTRADADSKADLPAVPRPPSDVVVKLSPPALSADPAREFARMAAVVTDYSHLDPHKPHPERQPADAAPLLPGESPPSLAGSSREPALPAATSPGVRPDLHPHGIQHATPLRPRVVHKPAVSTATDAHDTERLAGLALAAERVAGTPAKLGSIAVAAAILGALIVVSLM